MRYIVLPKDVLRPGEPTPAMIPVLFSATLVVNPKFCIIVGLSFELGWSMSCMFSHKNSGCQKRPQGSSSSKPPFPAPASSHLAKILSSSHVTINHISIANVKSGSFKSRRRSTEKVTLTSNCSFTARTMFSSGISEGGHLKDPKYASRRLMKAKALPTVIFPISTASSSVILIKSGPVTPAACMLAGTSCPLPASILRYSPPKIVK
mmetsp:Transcript_7951/g.15989  ORF Transcript_7951/g.15989 Transcript_7951/m.15989 type:complete len:207 (-) Transcript_7951:447-1067(-)